MPSPLARESGCLGLKVTPFGDAGRPAGGIAVADRGHVAGELVKVSTDGGEAVMARHSLVAVQGQQVEPGSGAVDHRLSRRQVEVTTGWRAIRSSNSQSAAIWRHADPHPFE